ncbi:hypothetical protein M2475_001825 [Breznakia sp. PF5-3]|uniref:hypothetical protein n=1 Tax=unclassified Breznakia TaxID=2623764 RepID=UPI0024055B00|nr:MULTISPECIES: hypothetical protein [unclassified Breznakia]MDF9825370.1 hypothetical protein [Breznakia sp. PM6-1]MDF9836248.1 hypothetical protein [Breznakia sp. PF5-3]MDF9838512.1 hypothetical protein [Breznakia sp. PFB2-8]MDF9860493.1 hypothetical protein [Breznakia sp. PH5-24]
MQNLKLLKKELVKKGVAFEKGLSNQEIIEIEKIYNITFPIEYIEFLKIGLPVSKGFYNWRDLTPENINRIKEKMNIPFIDIINYCDEIDYWPKGWGIRPETDQELKKKIELLLKEAPKLIPVYIHRYIPVTNGTPPIFSIMGLDIIYYGKNLFQYLEIEFGIKEYNGIKFEKIEHIKFWSDTINW